MEAKDTVMSEEQIEGIIDAVHDNNYRESIPPFELSERIAKEQAEISFKAGIKEVVSWMEENNETRDEPWGKDYEAAYGYDPMVEGDVLISSENWQAKLKEWGLDDNGR